jgi:hypothetical protein
MSSYRMYFSASVIVEVEGDRPSQKFQLDLARDAAEEAVEKALPGLDTFDTGLTIALSPENPFGLASWAELQDRH